MKIFTVLLVVFSFSPLTSFAASSWQCTGGDLEGMDVSESNGKLVGDVEWDCFPGGGICEQHAAVEEYTNAQGYTVYQGSHFKLIIDTTRAPSDNGYRAHISATDRVDAADQGRGLGISQEADCTQN